MQKANLNFKVLGNYFDFLINQGAVEEKAVGRDRIVYAITERGLYLIRCFKESNKVIPTLKIKSEIGSTKAEKELTRMSTKSIADPSRIQFQNRV